MTASAPFFGGPIPSPPPLRVVELPQDATAPYVYVPVPRHFAELRAVVDAVVEAHQVSEADIRGKSRMKRIVAARHLCWSLLRDRRWTFVDIGREWGCDHSTIQHGCRQIGGQR